MAIIRPLDGPGGEHRVADLGDDPADGAERPETRPFRVPESVWDVDAVLLVQHHPAPERREHGDVDPATRWNHPSAWSAGSSQPPLTVVRPEEPPSSVSGAAYPEQWLETIVQAAATARRADSTDAWRAVSAAADLVSEMARALELVAQATQDAADCHRDARHAARLAREAAEHAEAVARDAEAATRRAQELESAVAVARTLNSAESWGQVRRLAMAGGAADRASLAPRPSPDIA